jgi:hypothetical protein
MLLEATTGDDGNPIITQRVGPHGSSQHLSPHAPGVRRHRSPSGGEEYLIARSRGLLLYQTNRFL